MAKFIAQLARIIMMGVFDWKRYRKGDYYEGVFIQTKPLENADSFSVWVRLGMKGRPERQIIRYEKGKLTLSSTINI